MKKGDEIEAEVLRLDFPNKGICTAEGEKLIVKGVLPGQRIRCRVKRNGKTRKEARLLEVLERASIETETPCPHFSRCGGCSYQTLSAETELALKEGQVKRLLEPVLARYDRTDRAGEEGLPWDPPSDSPRRTGYRNKMEFTWGDSEKDGPLALGLHRRGSMYDIESVTGCTIIDADYRAILAAALAFFSPFHERGELSYYHRMSGEGYLRHLVVRKAAHTGEILVDLVTTSRGNTRGEGQAESGSGNDTESVTEHGLLRDFSENLQSLDLDGSIVGILHTINDSRADAVRDEGTTILYGTDHFYEELLGLRFRITPFSFFQTNSYSAEVLYRKVREYVELALRGKPVVYDLYSGTGTIAQIVADVAERVVGIEIVEEAVAAARLNAEENGITNCRFYAGDVLKLVDDPAIREENGAPDLLILDPPREGIHPKAMPKLIAFDVENIIYVSCKPSSLAVDLEALLAAGYRVRRIGIVNQFGFSVHCETCVLLSKASEA